MKNLLVLSLSICSLCFFSCNNSIEDAGSFYVGTNVNGDEVSISWINKAICGENDYFDTGDLKGKTFSDIEYNLLYNTEYKTPPKFKDIKFVDPREAEIIKNIKSPYVIGGLDKGKTYYMMLESRVSYEKDGKTYLADSFYSEVFEVKIP